ncbi:hypothetical protein WL32_38285 [Burkholderia cepacia]|nr:hypothetical protein WL32_38285 [Burkholderia cepacia]
MSRPKIGIRVIYDDSQIIILCVEAVNFVTRQNKYFSRGKFVPLILGQAIAAAIDHNADPYGWMSMCRLIEMRRNIQIIETRIALDDWWNEQAVRASVDIFEPAQDFDWPAGHVDTVIILTNARHTDKWTKTGRTWH